MRDARAKSAQVRGVCFGDTGRHSITQMVSWLGEKVPVCIKSCSHLSAKHFSRCFVLPLIFCQLWEAVLWSSLATHP